MGRNGVTDNATVVSVSAKSASFFISSFGKKPWPFSSSAFDAAGERLDEIAAGKSEGNHGR
jgi:hypothetical protein